MRLKSLFALFFAMSFGLLLSSCTPGVYVGASTGYGAPYGYGNYGPRYYGRPGYYAPPVRVVRPAPFYGPRGRGVYRGDGGFRGGHGGFQGGHGGGRRGGR
jgi:hypothetical protein